ncbi:hypothetical protein F2Q70_00006447 [Brassica cretica]|uniref:protein-serine/threonine phosphatase n=1 Tax=Brassica cretica TaxID=69181 RepID=A0A8S9ISI8_BRACR|nr:hypothetical protein F2Q70_00006447 [Brassica cretica]KAF3566094.1 hypothetical protein DY000_02019464 [Brassica cretica]
MATTCKHWVVHRQICRRCKSRVKTNDLARMAQISSPSRDPDCPHRMYCYGQCCRCGYFLDIFEYAPSFSYISRYLQLSPEFAASTKQRKLRIGLGQKKLHLVLGLEHILIHSIKLSQIADDDSGLLRDDIFRLPNDDILVKFRPFVRDFLSEAKEFFTMHVFTNYSPDHAKKVVSLLDPHMVYFGNRIITSRDSGGLKSLELVLAEPRGVIVFDYEPRSWRKRDLPNLVIISPKYEYFKANSSNKVVDGVLAKALNFFKNNKVFEVEGKRENGEDMSVLLTDLKALHELFFNGGYHDVTHVLPRVFESKEYFL